MQIKLLLIGILLIQACSPTREIVTTGSIERLDPALDSVLSRDAKVEIIATGFDWSEGPLWVENKQMLLFSDVPKNIVYKWTEQKGAEPYLSPSGYTGSQPRGGEMGSNGLTFDDEGNLVLCQHGDRRLAMMDAPLDSPKAVFTTIAGKFFNNRFNSPNDAVIHNHDFYLTDPPYGLEKQMDDPQKEIAYQGVYRVSAGGTVSSLVDSLTRPNGIAFSPDGKYLFVANSDPNKARWYRYTLRNDPTSEEVEGGVALTDGKIFFDATSMTATGKGLPDGMKIDSRGTVFASGPGGVYIFNPDGKLLGKINLQEATSNCALSADEKTLFVTNDMNILRIKMRP